MEQYDVSVVIPVYNSEDYIEECVKSIYEQDYFNLNRIQVILVDDGSTDSSLEICKKLKYRLKELSIEIITGENQGVSVTRNKGIKEAKGKYIMYIDSDDFISRNAIRTLVDFFDEHYEEIDLVTYSMDYYLQKDKKKKDSKKYVYFDKGTNVYDLDGEYYYLIQTNMNIVVKNYFEDNILFDTELQGHEDTKYDTQILMKKRKIGFVKEAKYMYRTHESQSTEIINNPYYTFNDMMNLFEYCIKNYITEKGHVHKYVQAIIVNIFRWRIAQNNLLPYFYEEKQYNEAINRIKNILSKIDNEIIVEDKIMDKYHKAFLIQQKNDKNICIQKSYDGRVYSINDDKRILFNENKIELVFNKIKIKKDKIYILGYLRSVLLAYIKPELWLIYNENNKKMSQNKKIDLSDNTLTNKYKTDMEVAKFYKFEIELNAYNLKSFEFKVNIEGKEFSIKYIFNTLVPLSLKLKNYKAYYGEYRLQYKPGEKRFLIKKPDKELIKKDNKRSVMKYLSVNKKIALYRFIALLLRNNKKKIWIYYDRKNVFDNGYEQFKHDVKIKDGIKKYYILDGKKREKM